LQTFIITPRRTRNLPPERGLKNDHILREAIWHPALPVDPMPLRRLGPELRRVVAAWELTPVEQAALATRV
jgi:hypothetical protein